MGEIEEHPEVFPAKDGTPYQAVQDLVYYLGRLKASRTADQDLDEATAAAMLIGVLFADAMSRDLMPMLFPGKPEEAVTRYVELFLRAIGAAKQ